MTGKKEYKNDKKDKMAGMELIEFEGTFVCNQSIMLKRLRFLLRNGRGGLIVMGLGITGMY